MKLPSFERSLAVVVGIDAYCGGISTLKTAVSDGKSVAELLHGKLAFDEVWTKYDAQATLQSLLKLLEEELPNAIGVNDRLLFYFAGHGIALTDEKGPQGFLIPQDAHHQTDSSWLPMHRFEQALSALKCRHCLLILDCCFGGAFRWSISTRHLGKGAQVVHKQRFDRFIKDPAWQVITSAAHDQEAIDVLSLYKDQRGSNNGCSHSPFAEALLEGLGGKADLSVQGGEGDGIITASELCMYLRDQVEPQTQVCQHRQTPELWTLKSHDKGEFVFLTDKFNRDHLKEAPRIDEDENPYRGLKSYEETNADLFFGRGDCIEKLRKKVEGDEQRFTVVLGASGSGKSSLVKAGLIPALKKAEAGNWNCRVIRPGDAPADILGAALTDLLASQGSQRLLVVDQAEELVTLCRDQEQRDQFLEKLASTLREDKTFHLLFTLRSDFEPQVRDLALRPYFILLVLLILPLLKDNEDSENQVAEQVAEGVMTWGLINLLRMKQPWFWKQQSRYIVPMFSREELKRVIEEPASQKVVRFESDKLVNDLIDEVAQMPGGLPLLSFGLSELYQSLARRFLAASQEEKMVDRIITAEDFKAVGGVATSLTKRAEEIYKGLKKKGEEMEGSMQRVLLRMVAEGGEMTRRRVLLSELKYPEPEDSRVQEILESFEQARLLTRDIDQKNRPYVEPAHDALVNGWTLLQNWAREQAPRHSLERQLSREVELWQSEKDKGCKKEALMLLWVEDPRLPQAAAFAFDKPKQVAAERWAWFKQALQAASGKWTAPGLTSYLFNKLETEFIEASLQERYKRTRIRAIIGAAVFLILAIATSIALFQRNRAQAQLLRTVGSQVTNSGELFDSHKDFDGLLTSLSAAYNLNQSAQKADTAMLSKVRDAILSSYIRRREKNRLEGHQGPVKRVLFSPDGRLLASDSSDETIRVWEAGSGKELMELNKADYKKPDFMFIDSGQLAIHSAGIIYFINPITKARTEIPVKEQMKNREIYFIGNSLVASKDKGSSIVHVWNLSVQGFKERNRIDSNRLVGNIAKPSLANLSLYSLGFSSNGRVVFHAPGNWVGGSEKKFSVWMDSGSVGSSFTVLQNGFITASSISSNGKLFIFGDEQGYLHIWDPVEGKEIIRYPSGQKRISSLYINEDSSRLVSGGWSNVVKIWDLTTKPPGHQLLSLAGHKDVIESVALNHKDDLLASASNDKTIKIWQVDSDRAVALLRDYRPGSGVAFSNDGKLLASTSLAKYKNENNSIYLMDTASKATLTTLVGHTHWIRSLSFSPNGKWLASAAWDGTFRLWDVDLCIKKKNCEAAISIPSKSSQYVTSVTFSPDGSTLATANNTNWDTPNEAQVWNLKIAKTDQPLLELRCILKGHKNFINNIIFYPGSDRLATSSDDESIKVWNASDCAESAFPDMKSSGKVRWVDVSHDGLTLASGGDDHVIRLWNAKTGQNKRQLMGHNGPVYAVRFGLSNTWLTSLSKDQTIKIWNLENGKERDIITLKAHRMPLGPDPWQNLSISKDERYMASVAEVGHDGELLFWNLKEIRMASLDTLVRNSCDFVAGYLEHGFSADNRNICDGADSANGDGRIMIIWGIFPFHR